MSGRQKQFPTGGISLFFLAMGPVLGAALFFTLKSLGWESDACWTAAVSAVCAVWWVFEPVPIPVTSLLPFALFPILGVLSPREVSESYGAPLILLCFSADLYCQRQWQAAERTGA